jgi:hypothetical protein
MLALTACLAMTAVASARPDYVGGGGLLPPVGTGGTGTPDDVFVDTINVPDSFNVTDITVTLNDMNHTWAGDLRVWLEAPDGATVDIVNRIGVIGGAGAGDSSDYGGTYSFNDSFAGDIWTVAAGLGSAEVIPGGDYFPTTVDGAVSSINSIANQNSMGNWTLRISDNAAGDTGDIGSWTLTLVPTPGALALFGLAGVCGSRRRRR